MLNTMKLIFLLLLPSSLLGLLPNPFLLVPLVLESNHRSPLSGWSVHHSWLQWRLRHRSRLRRQDGLGLTQTALRRDLGHLCWFWLQESAVPSEYLSRFCFNHVFPIVLCLAQNLAFLGPSLCGWILNEHFLSRLQDW